MDRTHITAEALSKLYTRIPPDWGRLKGIHETDYEWFLGTLSIDKRHPSFRIGWGFGLSLSSRFRKEPFTVAGQERVAAIFHQFDGAEHDKEDEEILVGWVEKTREAELDAWIAFLNGEIAERVQGGAGAT